MTPHPAPVEAALSAPTLHLLLLTGLAFFAFVAVASCAAPLYDRAVETHLRGRIAELEAQVAGLEAMNTEKAQEIRRLQRGNHPAGRALRVVDEAAWRDLQAALDARDAEHEGGEGS